MSDQAQHISEERLRIKQTDQTPFHKTEAKYEDIASSVAHWSTGIFGWGLAVLLVLALLGNAVYHDFNSHSLSILSVVVSVTNFLLLFVLQRTSNKTNHVQQIKLDMLLSENTTIGKDFVGIEEMSEGQLIKLKNRIDEIAHDRMEQKLA